MNKLQKELEKTLGQFFKPENIGAEFIDKKLKKIGIVLTKEQLSKIGRQFSNLQSNSIFFELEDEQLVNAGIKDQNEFQQIVNREFSDLVPSLKKFFKKSMKKIPSLIDGMSKKISKSTLKTLKGNAPEMLNWRDFEKGQFEANLYYTYRKAFDLLEMFLVISLEAGESINNLERGNAFKNKDFVFEVLTRLQARACQIASEILVLLKSGYADGAHARWRTLHEISVVGLFIGNNDNDLAERYLLYDHIECHKAAKIYQEHYNYLGYEPLSDEEIRRSEEIRSGLIHKYGEAYEKDYGWASHVLKKKKISFKDIEKAIGLDYLRPFYKMACHNIHANPRGIFFKLGLYPETDMLLAGPSNIGLADPGQATALSLMHITLSLLNHQPNLDRLVTCQILIELEKQIGNAFFKAECALKEKSF